MILDKKIEDYAYRHTRPESELLRSLADRTQREMPDARMLTGRLEGRFLKFLVKVSRAECVVEIGTFTGYSALSMAEGLGDRGRVITCENDPRARDFAQAAFDANPLGRRIELRFGPALETIRALEGTIDFSFIDADKENYPLYYEELLQRTRAGGLILLDNMLWSGRVLDPPDEESKILHELNEFISRDERVENVLLTVRDGVQLLVKR
jgi:caffeoyl-CoA O-methyltransferase